jgi:hypothetical protein
MIARAIVAQPGGALLSIALAAVAWLLKTGPTPAPRRFTLACAQEKSQEHLRRSQDGSDAIRVADFASFSSMDGQARDSPASTLPDVTAFDFQRGYGARATRSRWRHHSIG